jgi:hypothetical protein
MKRQLEQLGRGHRLLTGKLAPPLRCVLLGTRLLSMGMRSLPLLRSAPSLEGVSECSRGANAHG